MVFLFFMHTTVVPWYMLMGSIFPLVILAYHLGKSNVRKETDDERTYNMKLAQALQIQEIMSSPLVELFPDIQLELSKQAIEKFSEIGDEERVLSIHTEMANKIL
jgi:hypothetical protein